MSFETYLFGVTLCLLALRWVLFELFEHRDDGPSFWRFMAETRHLQKAWIKALMLGLVAAAGAYGWTAFP